MNRISLSFFAFVLLGMSGMALAELNQIPGCERERLLSYFPEDVVKEVLDQQGIPEEKWDSIASELSEKDEEIVKRVEEKARNTDSTPLRDPQQRSAAVKIFRQTLSEVFDEVMHENGITDRQQIQSMLDEIQRKKAARFIECIRKYHETAPSIDSFNENVVDDSLNEDAFDEPLNEDPVHESLNEDTFNESFNEKENF
ncbi:MAG: hypothetical protein WD595_05265 [Waddliaceae bacterium]